MDMQPIFRGAMGMDMQLTIISAGVMVVAAPRGEPAVQRRLFGACQRDRRTLADWIAGLAPATVVRERTGSYWKSPSAVLEKVSIRALVVNTQHVNKVPGC